MTTISTPYRQKALALEYQEVSRRSAIEGASAHRLTELLFEGAVKHINLAQQAIDNNDIESRGKSINKALDIITELRDTLDMDNGGSIAQNLYSLYTFMESSLLDAHLKADRDSLVTTAGLVADLLETWKSIK